MFRSIAIVMALCFATVTAQAALLGRAALTPGGTDYQAYYDDLLNITWIADANLALTNTFGVLGINPTTTLSWGAGSMNWATANEWIGAMNTATYLGKSDWRLPTVEPVNGSTFNYTASPDGSTDLHYNQSAPGTAYAGSTGSEMAHLFYSTLSNKGWCSPLSTPTVGGSCSSPQTGWGLSNAGPFSNLSGASGTWWSGTEYAPENNTAWVFLFNHGIQSYSLKSNPFKAWAVRDGDIGIVPVPASVWLFGSALGLMGVMRRKATA